MNSELKMIPEGLVVVALSVVVDLVYGLEFELSVLKSPEEKDCWTWEIVLVVLVLGQKDPPVVVVAA